MFDAAINVLKNKSLLHGNSGRFECFWYWLKLEIIGFYWLSLQNIKIPEVLSKLLSGGNITQKMYPKCKSCPSFTLYSHYYNFGNGSILMMSGRKNGTNLKHQLTDRFLSIFMEILPMNNLYRKSSYFRNVIMNTMFIHIHC